MAPSTAAPPRVPPRAPSAAASSLPPPSPVPYASTTGDAAAAVSSGGAAAAARSEGAQRASGAGSAGPQLSSGLSGLPSSSAQPNECASDVTMSACNPRKRGVDEEAGSSTAQYRPAAASAERPPIPPPPSLMVVDGGHRSAPSSGGAEVEVNPAVLFSVLIGALTPSPPTAHRAAHAASMFRSAALCYRFRVRCADIAVFRTLIFVCCGSARCSGSVLFLVVRCIFGTYLSEWWFGVCKLRTCTERVASVR